MAERKSIEAQEDAKIAALEDLFHENPVRACSIDFGVNNFAAITNNVGAECILFQVRRIKVNSQYYKILQQEDAFAEEQTSNCK